MNEAVTLDRAAGQRVAADPIATLPLTLTINGEPRQLEVAPWTSLLDLLRDKLDLTGSKKGCDHGQCGACTVLIDGKRMNSCLKLAVTLDGCEVTTIEGLGQPDNLHPLQAALGARARTAAAQQPLPRQHRVGAWSGRGRRGCVV